MLKFASMCNAYLMQCMLQEWIFHECRMDFEGVKLVGLDVEWKPELLSGKSSPASLLQVCSFAAINILPYKFACMPCNHLMHSLLTAADVGLLSIMLYRHAAINLNSCECLTIVCDADCLSLSSMGD